MSELLTFDGGNVRALEYFPETEEASPKLIATFAGGNRYAYSAVPGEVWDALQMAAQNQTVGTTFARIVRNAGFAYTKLDADDPDQQPPAPPNTPTERRFVRREPPNAPQAPSRTPSADRRRTRPA